MKKLLFVLSALFAFTFVACDENTSSDATTITEESTEETTEKTAEEIAEENMEEVDPNQKEFGEKVDAAAAISLEKVVMDMEGKDSAEYVAQVRVVEVCQNKGCWMKIVPAGETTSTDTLMVKFKDYGFFMPKNLAGGEVILQGKAKRQVTPMDELRHYAEDAGKSEEEIMAITEDKEEIVFIADGVRII